MWKMTEIIAKNEVLNDGRIIHLYFNSMVGLYVAYGVSAYLLCKHAHARPSYSEEMQMPAAVINAGHYEELKKQIDDLRELLYAFRHGFIKEVKK